MRAEMDHIDAPGAALAFAAGCLWASLTERLAGGRARQLSGRAVLVAIGLTCGAFHLGCAVSGVGMLRGGRLDPVLARLADDVSAPTAMIAYRDARPLILLMVAALGIAHVAAAWQAWFGHLRAFVTAWSVGAALAVALCSCILIFARTGDGVLIQLAGLALQAAALLWLLDPDLADQGKTPVEDNE